MPKLKVDFEELQLAFETDEPESTYYLNTETGEVAYVSDETRAKLEDIYAEMYGDGDEPRISLDEALAAGDLEDWEREEVRVADQVEEGYGTRLVEIPRQDSRTGYRDMEAFIETVPDRRLEARLGRAIQGRGAFRRFKDTVAEDAREQQRWYAFRDERLRARILEWFEEEEIEATFE